MTPVSSLNDEFANRRRPIEMIVTAIRGGRTILGRSAPVFLGLDHWHTIAREHSSFEIPCGILAGQP
jgi:hypothetical protein